MTEERSPISQHDVVRALVPDPSDVPDLRVLVGFLGESTREEDIRLYVSPDLTTYFVIPREALLHTLSLKTDRNPLGGTIVWVRRDLNLRSVSTTSREAESDFLTGGIAQSFTGGLRIPPRRPVRPGRQFALHYTVKLSCVYEFCDWFVYSWWAGGDVYCTELYQCN